MFESDEGRKKDNDAWLFARSQTNFDEGRLSVFVVRLTMFLPIGIAFVFSSLFLISNAHEYNEDGWAKASGFLLASIDPNHDLKKACSNFYSFACGKWANRASDEGSDEMRAAESQLRDELISKLKIKPGRMNKVKQAPYEQSLQVMYNQCIKFKIMNETELTLALHNALEKAANEFKSEAIKENITAPVSIMWFTAGYFERLFMVHAGMESSVDWIIQNCTKKSILKLSYPLRPEWIGGWGLIEEGKDSREEVIKLEVEMRSLYMALNNGTLDDLEEQKVDSLAVNLYLLLADLVGLAEEEAKTVEKGKKNENVMKLSQLKSTYPSVDWDAYLIGLFGKENANEYITKTNPDILVVGHTYFQLVPILLERHTLETIRFYAYWKLRTQVREFYLFHTARLSTVDSDKAKVDFCYELLKKFAPAAVARMFFDNLNAGKGDLKPMMSKLRNDVSLVGQNVLAAFRIFVSGQDWLDSQDKMALIRRINTLRVDTGVPLWLADDKKVIERTPQFDKELSVLENVVHAQRGAFQRTFRPLLVREEEFEEPPPVLTAGAEYANDKINLYLGQLLPPLYRIQYPLALKYGMLGWLIGHKLMEAFDEASLVAAVASGKSLLREEVDRMFHQRKHCLVRQYSAYCYKGSGGKCLSGKKTVNANVGDIEGLKIAYMAYKFITQTMGPEPPVPELVRLTNDQIFFISAAQLHCGKQRDTIKEDSKLAPSQVRVDQSMRNFPVFAKAFKCTKGSKYAPIRTCSLWGRFVSPGQCDVEEEEW